MNTLFLATAILLPAAEPTRPIDFDTEIVPILTRAGCNTGACHGAAIGRGGFKLSLWGSDPEADHIALVHELEGRRVNLARPEESLLLRKPTRALPHGGGRRLERDGPGVQRLLAWLRSGAARVEGRKLQNFEVETARLVVEKLGDSVSFKAIARFDDGSVEDVTSQAVYTADDPTAVEIDDGKVTLHRRGQATVIVRYLDRVVPIRWVVPLGAKAIDLSGEPRRNFIDDEVLATLSTLRLPVAPPADDASFLRRVRLDLTGTLPTPDEMRTFTADRDPNKRPILIDRLLDSEEFVDYWTLKWGNLLRISSRSLGKDGARAFHDWVREQVRRNRPLEETARALVTALGDGRREGAANFARIPNNGREHAEYVSRVFLGVRLQCANCHNHPLDRWTQDDYHGLAAVFARLDRAQVVRLTDRGDIIHPRTGEPALPRLPGTKFLEAEKDHRESFARWLTDSENPYFARAAVNRLWQEMMGRGLVEPVDDLRETNPATHPSLLNQLASDFVKHGYDVQHTLRRIANSATYQRSGQTTDANANDDRYYSHALTRPLPAEVQADALALVTGVAERYGDLPVGTRAITLYDSQIPSPALDVLGRCSRTAPCEEESFSRGGLARTLHLINGDLINRKITAPEGRLAQLLDGKRSNTDIVEEFYRLALGRVPSAKENAFWAKSFAEVRTPRERREVFEDFLWSLLTCREFTTNH